MNFTRIALASVLGATLMSPMAHAEDEFEAAIEARQGLMQVYSFSMGTLSAMARGKMEYDAEIAATAANNLKIASGIDSRAMWPAGSDADNAEDTDALASMWGELDKVGEYHMQMVEAAAALADVAGNGAEQMGAAVQEVGKSCKGCHDDYRED